jgi:hypothetical protein
MLFIWGIRFARIGRFIDKDHICYPCKASDREIRVYRRYFHFCYIPVFPLGRNQVDMHCRNCGDETRLEKIVKQYDAHNRTPFYLYSAIILFVLITAGWFYWNSINQKHKAEYVANPAIGDVYTVNEEKNTGKVYYFLKIIARNGDSVTALHSDLDYYGLVNGLSVDDYFVKADTLVFTKKMLGEMLESDEINTVRRDYGDREDFSRIR